jgi:hypothetical protein
MKVRSPTDLRRSPSRRQGLFRGNLRRARLPTERLVSDRSADVRRRGGPAASAESRPASREKKLPGDLLAYQTLFDHLVTPSSEQRRGHCETFMGSVLQPLKRISAI